MVSLQSCCCGFYYGMIISRHALNFFVFNILRDFAALDEEEEMEEDIFAHPAKVIETATIFRNVEWGCPDWSKKSHDFFFQRLALRESNISRYEAEFAEICTIGFGQFGSVHKCINRLGKWLSCTCHELAPGVDPWGIFQGIQEGGTGCLPLCRGGGGGAEGIISESVNWDGRFCKIVE